MKFESDLDEEEYRTLMRADRHLAAVHRACLRQAELSDLARQPRQVDVWRQVAADIAGRVSRLDYTLNRQYPGKSGNAYAIVEDLGHAWIAKALRDVGTARGLGQLAGCLVGATPALDAVAEAVSAAHDALVSLADAHRANERKRVEGGRFKARAA